jgi:hypothetical protein
VFFFLLKKIRPFRYKEPKSLNTDCIKGTCKIIFIVIEIAELSFQAYSNTFDCNNVEMQHKGVKINKKGKPWCKENKIIWIETRESNSKLVQTES